MWWIFIALAPLLWLMFRPGPFISFVMCVAEGLRRTGGKDDRVVPRWPGESRLDHFRRFWRFQRWYDRKHRSGGGTGLEIAIVRLDCGDSAHIYANNTVAVFQACVCAKHGMTKIAEVSVVLTLNCGHQDGGYQRGPLEVGGEYVCHHHDFPEIVRITAIDRVYDNCFAMLTVVRVAEPTSDEASAAGDDSDAAEADDSEDASDDSDETNHLVTAHWGGW
jgi:hypothetical protein